MGFAEFIFWFSFLMIGYTYLGYPFVLLVWSRIISKNVSKEYITPEPMISIIIAAYNEEKNIGRRIENLLKQDYPADKMEIIVVSDGSTDLTTNIVERLQKNNNKNPKTAEISPSRLKLIELKENLGKPNALNLGVSQSVGEFIIFTDTRQEFKSDAIKELIANFNDPDVGCVSGELVFRTDSSGAMPKEMDIYWDFEKRIRKLESSINSVVGATGAIYTVRKSLCPPVPTETLLDDVYIPMQIVLSGYRNVLDRSAVAYDVVTKDIAKEKRRKVRTLLGNYQILKLMPQLLSPNNNPLFLRYLSHKVLRLFIPFFFLALVISATLVSGSFYKLILFLSLFILFLSVNEKLYGRLPILGKIGRYASAFVSLNYFALIAFFKFISPKKRRIW
jgi:cellulose synthase/poly-beta-1,6-N-acetylglucosamine synthase-like glycosyltransferase